MNNAKKIFEPFLTGKLFDDESFCVKVTFINEKTEESLLKKCFQPSRFQNTGNLSYFVAEFCVNIHPQGGYFILSHAFKLDLTQLKIELCKIDDDQGKIYSSGQKIAIFLTNHYESITQYLRDFNSVKDNYPAIAKEILNHRGGTTACNYGI